MFAPTNTGRFGKSLDETATSLSCDYLTLSQVGAKWLANWCMHNVGDQGATDVASTVAVAVLGGGSAQSLASELYNLVGDSAFEAIQVRQPIVSKLCTLINCIASDSLSPLSVCASVLSCAEAMLFLVSDQRYATHHRRLEFRLPT